MPNIYDALRQLNRYVKESKTLDEIEDILEGDEPEANIEKLNSVQNARNQHEVQNILQDICSECRAARVSDALPDELDSWEKLSDIIEPNKMLGYLSSLIELGKINPKDPINLRLSLNSSRAYLMLLTIPGAKVVGVFDDNLVKQALKIDHFLKVIPKFNKNETIFTIIQCVSLLEAIQMLLRYVSFEKDLKMVVVHCVTLFMLHYHESSSRGKCK